MKEWKVITIRADGVVKDVSSIVFDCLGSCASVAFMRAGVKGRWSAGVSCSRKVGRRNKVEGGCHFAAKVRKIARLPVRYSLRGDWSVERRDCGVLMIGGIIFWVVFIGLKVKTTDGARRFFDWFPSGFQGVPRFSDWLE